jgi:uncharacterized protein (TIGR03435 family)
LVKLLAAIIVLATAQAQDATVKPNTRTTSSRLTLSPLAAEGTTLHELIRMAYAVRDFQIAEGPAWIKSDRWDVTARPLDGPIRNFINKPLPPLQDLLREKFGLKLHRETREIPIFTLSVSKYGAELRRSKVTNCAAFKIGRYSPPPGERPEDCSGVERGPNLQLNETLDAVGMSVPELIKILSQELDRIVIDKTGLPGYFDVRLEWNRDATKHSNAEDEDSPSLFTAVERQLGLKLEPGKGPVEVLVIDHAEKPNP